MHQQMLMIVLRGASCPRRAVKASNTSSAALVAALGAVLIATPCAGVPEAATCAAGGPGKRCATPVATAGATGNAAWGGCCRIKLASAVADRSMLGKRPLPGPEGAEMLEAGALGGAGVAAGVGCGGLPAICPACKSDSQDGFGATGAAGMGLGFGWASVGGGLGLSGTDTSCRMEQPVLTSKT
jgi:hypothetical protein